MKLGKITKGIAGFYYVDVNGELFECKARGIFRKNKIIPLIGDQVTIEILDESKRIGMIEEIKPRYNELIRPTVANIDQVVVVFSIVQPDLNLFLLDRFLILGESKGLDILICLNKTDLIDNKALDMIKSRYQKTNYKILTTNIINNQNLDDLKKKLLNKTSVFAGPSGVGKSSILKEITGSNLEVGEVSVKTGRGKHTTRHAELLAISNNSWVVDTPGFSSLDIDYIDINDLSDYFPEFNDYIESCKFASCSHINEPGCKVKQAVAENIINNERYESYIQFYKEIKESSRRY
ncbi:ribosome small subunit-dependent GTPase A [Serpentinicella sp. ANB-PHB4]|uniref:ribosome small subunit-dependent GTPase A n=1 Tax=Serpentinicella sp. ANB-PHB4 TaxID=3074076 RepID=UPI0028666F82|nr:ribosome small subunit-dependent GTPase A [Serpentinicella sp. ANB-PHB4]MDR5658316.1 ribosome small subunit-dependent GTPase A [Serpentinicella sp. ANB-PHB4]